MTRRLAVTVLSAASDIWGTERSILNLAPHLHDLGVELTVASPVGAFSRACADAGIGTLELVLPPRGGARTHPLRDLVRDAAGVPRGVARIVRATRGADVVHSNNLLVHPDAAIAGRLSRRPTVLELHDIVAPGAPAMVQSGAAALSAAVVSISHATSDPVRGPGRRRVSLVPQAVDLDRFSTGPGDLGWRSVVQAPVVVGVVGRVDPSKGVDVVVRAAALAGPDIGVVVAGAPSMDAGDHLEEVRRLGEQLLGPRFHYAGTTERVPALLRSLDVLVNASDAEPFGLSVLEAQACGTAVVGTASGGIPDFVTDGETGLLFPPRDVDALASALRRLADDVTLRTRLAEAGRESVQSTYSIQARARTLAALYHSVARA